MPSTTQSAQNSEAPVTQAGTVPDGTLDDSKIFVEISSVKPPTRPNYFTLQGGSEVTFYCTPAAKGAFLADPKAVTKAIDIDYEAHEQSYDFTNKHSQTGQEYSVDQMAQWNTRAKELEAASQLEVHAFNDSAKGSNISMEVVRNPTEKWKASRGVSAVKLFELKDAAIANQRLLACLNKGDPSHPSSSRSSGASVSKTGDSANGEQ